MTGRRAGYCSGYAAPGYANPTPGFGMGMGYGGGRGWRHRFYATGVPGWARYDAPPLVPPSSAPRMTRDAEMEWLKAHVEDLQSALQQANERISELDKPSQQ
jgi:hypothetical protein